MAGADAPDSRLPFTVNVMAALIVMPSVRSPVISPVITIVCTALECIPGAALPPVTLPDIVIEPEPFE